MASFGIVGYGSYIPAFRIKVEEIARVWGEDADTIQNGLLVTEKSVPDVDEDTITISVEAGRNALARAQVDAQKIGAIFIGSESHPYAVKPSGVVVAEALGLGTSLMTADFQFACKAGTAAIQVCLGLAKSGMVDYGLAIGADTAQGRPGDALEYTAAAGGAAFVIGKDPVATIDHTCSFTTDTSDFWRREGEQYPSHGARFTGKPAYFKHVVEATKMMLQQSGHKPTDFDHVVLHMPNVKFPLTAAKMLGFDTTQLEAGLITKYIGNTYAGCSPLGLCRVLDTAKPGQKILVTSYGSGAGSDCFVLTVTDRILAVQDKAPKTDDYVSRKTYLDYGTYARYRKKLKL